MKALSLACGLAPLRQWLAQFRNDPTQNNGSNDGGLLPAVASRDSLQSQVSFPSPILSQPPLADIIYSIHARTTIYPIMTK